MGSVSYATLAQLRIEQASTLTTQDAVLLDFGRRMTAAIDAYMRKHYVPTVFAPRKVTLYYDCRGQHILDGGKRLELDAFFAALSTVTDGEGTVLVADTDYYAQPRGKTPIRALHRFDGNFWTAYDGDTPVAQIAIAGDECYREYYAEAWESATTTAEELDASETGVDVTSAALLSPGMLIRVDSEYMVIDSISTNTLTVTRGARGSTAATHTNAAALTYFVPEPAIVQACMRWAALAFARKGAFELTRFDGTASVQFPDAIPDGVKQLLNDGGWTQVRPVLI